MGRFGVWGNCDACGCDTWVIAWERDYLDEPISYICGGGCTGCDCDDWDGYDFEGDE